MHDACGSNDLVCRVAPEVKAGGGSGDFEVDRPDMQTGQHTPDLAVVEVHVQSAKLDELGEFPQHDGRDRPPVT